MGKCSLVLMYEGYPKSTPLGLTDDQRLMILVKRQLLKEAAEALRGAEVLGDAVLVSSFRANLCKLQDTLDLVIPPEIEELYVDNEPGGQGGLR